MSRQCHYVINLHRDENPTKKTMLPQYACPLGCCIIFKTPFYKNTSGGLHLYYPLCQTLASGFQSQNNTKSIQASEMHL